MSVQRVLDTVREDVRLGRVDAAGVLVGEGVRTVGLDPSRVLAVIPADCARGGRISTNGTLYLPEELQGQHVALCEAAKTRFVGGEMDLETGRHPEQPGWAVPVRLFDGDVVQEADGSILTRARFAVLNTGVGRDLLTCWQEGMDVGVSLYGGAYANNRTLTQESRFAAMNPASVGKAYCEYSGFRMQRYDIVRDPSFGTNFAPATTQAREAFERVAEAFRGAPGPAAESSHAPLAGAQSTEETTMSFKNIDELRAAHPDLVKAIEAAANPMSGLDPAQRELLERLIRVTEGTERPDVQAALKAVQESAGVERERVATLESGLRALQGELATVKEQSASEKAARQALQTKLDVMECLDGLKKGRGAIGERVAQFVREELDGGRVTSTESAKALYERQFKFVEDAAKLAQVGGTGTGAGGGAATRTAESTAGGGNAGATGAAGGTPPQESPDSSPTPARESVSPLLKVVRNHAVGG